MALAVPWKTMDWQAKSAGKAGGARQGNSWSESLGTQPEIVELQLLPRYNQKCFDTEGETQTENLWILPALKTSELLLQRIPWASIPANPSEIPGQEEGKATAENTAGAWFVVLSQPSWNTRQHRSIHCSQPAGTKIMKEQRVQRRGGDGCIRTEQTPPRVFSPALWDGGRLCPTGACSCPSLPSPGVEPVLHLQRRFFYVETGVGCMRLELFNNNNNTKRLERMAFAAAVFIVQAELSLIR